MHSITATKNKKRRSKKIKKPIKAFKISIKDSIYILDRITSRNYNQCRHDT